MSAGALTSEELYKANLRGGIGGGIITHEASGKQLIAVALVITPPLTKHQIVVLGLP